MYCSEDEPGDERTKGERERERDRDGKLKSTFIANRFQFFTESKNKNKLGDFEEQPSIHPRENGDRVGSCTGVPAS